MVDPKMLIYHVLENPNTYRWDVLEQEHINLDLDLLAYVEQMCLFSS